MGKYMRKAETTGDVAVIDGVRTRAQTLALRRLQSTAAAPTSDIPHSYCYLELRSRRLLSKDARKSTPCSSTMGSNTGQAPGSSAASGRGALSSLFMNVSPTPFELEEFFTREEQALQRLFTEKYNFDFVNELPLPGRYEWVKVSP